MHKTYRQLIYGATLLLLGFLLTACGGSGGSDSTASSTTVSGVVLAGPASGATVTAKNAAGTIVAGPVTTAADGTYTIAIPNTALAAELIFEASGGTFPDEATAATGVALGALSTHLAAGAVVTGTNVTIDPSSTIIRELIKGKTRAAALTAFTTAFGYSPDSSVRPVFACVSTAATTAQRLAGLRAAAFSQLVKDLGIPAAKQHELLLALAEDLADDVLDGKATGGAAVTTASGTAIPADIGNRFSQALVGFQLSAYNKSKLKPDQIGAPAFHKKALTASYIVEYLPGTMAAATGKSMFRIKLSNLDGSPASGKAVTLRPYMYMSTKSHTTPLEAVVESTTPGTYDCTVYYVMSSVMSGISMGFWELAVTIDGSETAIFYPVVAMPMGNTTLTKLSGVTDAIMGLAGQEKRTWFLFNDGLTGVAGNNTFKLFLATKEMGATLTFPAVKVGDSLNNAAGSPWQVTAIAMEVSTDAANWTPATDSGAGHWTAGGLSGLTAGTAGKIYVRLTVNGELKTTDGLPLAASGSNGYQTFTVTP